MLREYVFDLVDHLARARNPDAARLAPEYRRYLGLGNAAATGLVPFVVNHPHVMHQWCMTHEVALAKAKRRPAAPASDASNRFAALLQKAIRHFTESARPIDGVFATADTLVADLRARSGQVRRVSATRHDRRQARGLALDRTGRMGGTPRATRSGGDPPFDLHRALSRHRRGRGRFLSCRRALRAPAGDAGRHAPRAARSALRLGARSRVSRRPGVVLLVPIDEGAARRAARRPGIWPPSSRPRRRWTRSTRPSVCGHRLQARRRRRRPWPTSCAPGRTCGTSSPACSPLRDSTMRSCEPTGCPSTFSPFGAIRFALSFYGLEKFEAVLPKSVRGTFMQGAPIAQDVENGVDGDWPFPLMPTPAMHDTQRRTLRGIAAIAVRDRTRRGNSRGKRAAPSSLVIAPQRVGAHGASRASGSRRSARRRGGCREHGHVRPGM